MSARTGIEWTDATWNPWHGCLKVSPGCKNCYMYAEKKQYGQMPDVVARSKSLFDAPLRWVRRAAHDALFPLPKLVFTCSWSDFFIAEADAWRAEAWDVIRRTPQITYQVLTKRPERFALCLPDDWGAGYPNVWLGVSVENQAYADRRIPELLGTPAAVRWISAEPLLEAVDVSPYLGYVEDADYKRGLDWVVVGGESGIGAREFSTKWARAILRECRAAGVPAFVKQLGRKVFHDGATAYLNLTDKRGADPEEWPADLRVREFPQRVRW